MTAHPRMVADAPAYRGKPALDVLIVGAGRSACASPSR
jgi:hypothetical protein